MKKQQHEANIIEAKTREKAMAEQKKFKQKQRQQMELLIEKIQQEKIEQVENRKFDTKRLMQRNKNIVADMNFKHQLEERQTAKFLHFSLGKQGHQKGSRYKRMSLGQMSPIFSRQSQLSALSDLKERPRNIELKYVFNARNNKQGLFSARSEKPDLNYLEDPNVRDRPIQFLINRTPQTRTNSQVGAIS